MVGKPATRTISPIGDDYIDGLLQPTLWASSVTAFTYSYPSSGAFYTIGHLHAATKTAGGSGYTPGTYNFATPGAMGLSKLSGSGTSFMDLAQAVVGAGTDVTGVTLFTDSGSGIQVGDTYTVIGVGPGSGCIFTVTAILYGGGEAVTSFGELISAHKSAVDAAYASLGRMLGITFTKITESAILHADFRHAYTNVTRAFTYLPNTTDTAGDSWYEAAAFSNPVIGNYGWSETFHEIGHGLGLKHPHETSSPFPILPNGSGNSADRDAIDFTLESYRQYPSAGTTGGIVVGVDDYMAFDRQAFQQWYPKNTSITNVTLAWDPTTGVMSRNGVAGPAPGNNTVLTAITDSGAGLILDFSAYTTDMTLTLVSTTTGGSNWITPLATQVRTLAVGHDPPGCIQLPLDTTTAILPQNIKPTSGSSIIAFNVSAASNTLILPFAMNIYTFAGSGTTWTITNMSTGQINTCTNINFGQFSGVLVPTSGFGIYRHAGGVARSKSLF